jgi:hypothetical protein
MVLVQDFTLVYSFYRHMGAHASYLGPQPRPPPSILATCTCIEIAISRKAILTEIIEGQVTNFLRNIASLSLGGILDAGKDSGQ